MVEILGEHSELWGTPGRIRPQPRSLQPRLVGQHPSHEIGTIEDAEPPGYEGVACMWPVIGMGISQQFQPKPDAVGCVVLNAEAARSTQAIRQVVQETRCIQQRFALPIVPACWISMIRT